MMEDFIVQYTSDTPSQTFTDVQRQESDTSLHDRLPFRRQVSEETIVPIILYDTHAKAYSADGSEKLVVSRGDLQHGDPAVRKIQGDMIDSRELINELQTAVDALRVSMKISTQVIDVLLL